MRLKNIYEKKKSLIHLFASLWFLCFLGFLCVWNLFVKKKQNYPNDLIYITT